MLPHVEKIIKNDLFKMFKNEADNYILRKKKDKQRQLELDRDYLEQSIRKDMINEDKMRLAQLRLKSQHKDCYSRPVIDRPMVHSRIKDVIINAYGFKVKGAPDDTNHKKGMEFRAFSSNDIFTTPIQKKQYFSKDMEIIHKEDNMSHYLTDLTSGPDLNNYSKQRHFEQMKYYKEMLDSQCNQNKSISPIPKSDRIRNAVILQHYRRFQVPSDPYYKKRNDCFGSSTLERNPILNPVNNIDYNRYFRFSNNGKGPILPKGMVWNWGKSSNDNQAIKTNDNNYITPQTQPDVSARELNRDNYIDSNSYKVFNNDANQNNRYNPNKKIYAFNQVQTQKDHSRDTMNINDPQHKKQRFFYYSNEKV